MTYGIMLPVYGKNNNVEHIVGICDSLGTINEEDSSLGNAQKIFLYGKNVLMTAGDSIHVLQLTKTLPDPMENLACSELVKMIVDYAKIQTKKGISPELQLLVGGTDKEKQPEVYRIDLMQGHIRNAKDYALNEPIGEIGSGMEKTSGYEKIKVTCLNKSFALWTAYNYFKIGSKNISVDRNMGFCFIDRETTRISHNGNTCIKKSKQYNAYLNNLLGGKIGISTEHSLQPSEDYDTTLRILGHENLADSFNSHLERQLMNCDWMAKIHTDIYDKYIKNLKEKKEVDKSEDGYKNTIIKLHVTIDLLMKGGLENILKAINIAHEDIVGKYT